MPLSRSIEPYIEPCAELRVELCAELCAELRAELLRRWWKTVDYGRRSHVSSRDSRIASNVERRYCSSPFLSLALDSRL